MMMEGNSENLEPIQGKKLKKNLPDILTTTEFLYTGGKKHMFDCSFCARDITQQCRIVCAVCVNFHLCSDCFAAGINLRPHVNTHDYRVVDCLDFNLFLGEWTAAEELNLLEGNILTNRQN